MPSVRVTLAVGLALSAIALVVVLSHSPVTVIGTNSIRYHIAIGAIRHPTNQCELGRTLPEGTTAIRVSASANTGPKVNLTALSGEEVVSHGERGAGWGIAETVTVPVSRVPSTVADSRICVAFGRLIEPVQINGALVRRVATNGSGATTVIPAFRIEYLHAGHSSWWSLASSVARHMGLGRAASGTWIVLLVIALMLTVVVLTSRLILRELQ